MNPLGKDKETEALKKWLKAGTDASRHQMKCEQCYEAIGGRVRSLCVVGKTLFVTEYNAQNELGEVRRKIRPQTPTPEEGPPTLNEAKMPHMTGKEFGAYDWASKQKYESVAAKNARLLADYIKRVEELRKAHEELVVAVRLLYKEFAEGLAQRGKANSAKYKLADAMAKIDALTPEPQGKEQ